MTEAEARQLKPGDRVLVEMLVCPSGDNGCIVDGDGEVLLMNRKRSFLPFNPEDIREKVDSPRRKFKEGDIVRFYDSLREVECFNPVPMVGLYDDGDDPEWVEAAEVTLVCAVEDRTDRSAAADGSGVTRKEGEV